MQPFEILRELYIRHRHLFQSSGCTLEVLRRLIGTELEIPILSTRLRERGWHKPHHELFVKLRRPDVQAAIKQKLGLENIDVFGAPDEAALLDMLPTAGDAPEADADLTELHPGELMAGTLMPTEVAALEALASALTSARREYLAWRCEFGLGPSFLAHHLCEVAAVREKFSGGVFILNPGTGSEPYEAAMKALAAHLRVPEHSGKIVEKLSENRALAVLVRSDNLARPQRKGAPAPLARQVIDEADRSGYRVAVMTVGKFGTVKEDGAALAERVQSKLLVPPEDRWSLFFERWRAVRSSDKQEPDEQLPAEGGDDGQYDGEEASPVLKRANWHYLSVKGRKVYPINIRFRAFIAANLANYATFDPTAGLRSLAGGRAYPADIRMFIDDVEAFLQRFKSPKRAVGPLRLLRFISTSRFWVSHSGLREMSGERGEKKVLPFASVPILNELDEAVTWVNEAPEPRFVAGIGVKAIIQDKWREDDPLGRARAHYSIARRMQDNPDEQKLLNNEYPVEPHLGEAVLVLTSETIRHYMRTIEAVKVAPQLNQLPFDGTPSPPRGKGCVPREVLDHCFSTLYLGKLSERRRSAEGSVLLEQHGGYGLACELLQLMSEGGVIGKPHPALHPNLHREFVRECGNALFNVGDLDGAIRCFESLKGIGAEKVAMADGLLAYLETGISDILDLSEPVLERGDRKRTAELIEEAAASLAELDRRIESASLPEESPWRERSRRLTLRVAGRQAMLAYLNDEPERAMTLLRPVSHRPDEASLDDQHLRIAAVSRRGGQKDRSEALALCLASMLRQTSKGHQHHALGFQITLARMLRREGFLAPAEEVLDYVHADILGWGCSERVFLGFLLEAGKLLIRQGGRDIRAYAAYLRPCMQRARRRNFARVLEISRHYAGVALQAIRLDASRRSGAEWDAAIDEAVAEDGRYVARYAPPSLGKFARDPFYGYAFADAVTVIQNLRTADGIASYIEEPLLTGR
jgi:hypothetical protein